MGQNQTVEQKVDNDETAQATVQAISVNQMTKQESD